MKFSHSECKEPRKLDCSPVLSIIYRVRTIVIVAVVEISRHGNNPMPSAESETMPILIDDISLSRVQPVLDF